MEHARHLIDEMLHNRRSSKSWTAPDAERCDLYLIQTALLNAIPDDEIGVTADELKEQLKLSKSQFDRGIRKLREANQIRGQRRELHKVFYRRWHG